MLNKLLSAQQETTVVPEGVSFDGSTDYLSRSSDLVGNVDSKTFTFSCWFYTSPTTGNMGLYETLSGGSLKSYIYVNKIGQVIFKLWGTTTATWVLNGELGDYKFGNDTFNNLIISIDLASASNRKVYLNDVDVTASCTWYTYTNEAIDFTHDTFRVNDFNTTTKGKGRLSHLFLDYTYRDLSIEANRRLFITADGKPADGLASLSPILYLPMTDASTAHVNLGTGGDFVQNGTLATADRGANQDNCKASKFDGVDDYLSKGGNLGVSNGKQLTYSGVVIQDDTTWGYAAYSLRVLKTSGSANIFIGHTVSLGKISSQIQFTDDSSAYFVYDYNNNTSLPYHGRSWHVSYSIDTSDNTKRKVIINGVDVSNQVTWNTYSNTLDINFAGAEDYIIAANTATPTWYYKQTVGELYFDTTYIDLATNNPFWDSTTNKPIPVRTAMANLGSNPLICCPLDASNPTKNYGSGGDFTLNGGGLVGARGASEYIVRGMFLPGGIGHYLLNTSTGLTSTKTMTIIFSRKATVGGLDRALHCWDAGETNKKFFIDSGAPQGVSMEGLNSSNVKILSFLDGAGDTLADEWATVAVSFDLTDTAKRACWLDRVKQADTSFTTYTNDNIDLSSVVNTYIGAFNNDNSGTGVIGGIYISLEYFDLTTEDGLNTVINQLGYPRDLTPEIDAGNIPTPLIYLPFDDPSNLGKNLGTGGDFSVVGTVTAGSDFTI